MYGDIQLLNALVQFLSKNVYVHVCRHVYTCAGMCTHVQACVHMHVHFYQSEKRDVFIFCMSRNNLFCISENT